MENEKIYYEVPTQVIFMNRDPDIDGDHTFGGIAYHDFVICGDCGLPIGLEEAIIVKELPWISISEEIKGD